MAILSENMVFSKTRTQDLRNVKQLNCWGSELTDVAIVRQMPNVQVLSLSVNNITSLEHFGTCKNLCELYLRENKIKDLNGLVHLQELQHLKKLWLAGNPCADIPNYRMTVLKALPNLEMLDNIAVTEEEVERAEDVGADLNSPGCSQPPASPERRQSTPPTHQHQQASPRVAQQQASVAPSTESYRRDEEEEDDSEEYEDTNRANGDGDHMRHGAHAGNSGNHLQDSPHSPGSPQLTNGHASQAGLLRQSQQRLSYPEVNTPHWNSSPQPSTRPPPAHLSGMPTPVNVTPMVRSASINDYALFNGSGGSSQQLNAHATNGHDSYTIAGSGGANGSKQSYQRMLPKGGKNRNANILSAVLCLIKELDQASLEVVDTEIHCRMEEMDRN